MPDVPSSFVRQMEELRRLVVAFPPPPPPPVTWRVRLAQRVGTAGWHAGSAVTHLGRLLERAGSHLFDVGEVVSAAGSKVIDAGDALADRVAGR